MSTCQPISSQRRPDSLQPRRPRPGTIHSRFLHHRFTHRRSTIQCSTRSRSRPHRPVALTLLLYARTHTRTHARTHALTHSLTHAHTHARIHALAYRCVRRGLRSANAGSRLHNSDAVSPVRSVHLCARALRSCVHALHVCTLAYKSHARAMQAHMHTCTQQAAFVVGRNIFLQFRVSGYCWFIRSHALGFKALTCLRLSCLTHSRPTVISHNRLCHRATGGARQNHNR